MFARRTAAHVILALALASVASIATLSAAAATPATAAAAPAGIVAAPATSKDSSNGSQGRPGPTDVHRAYVTCRLAPFYVWPNRNAVPFASAYAPAQLGDAFDVIGDGTLAEPGLTLYETTIDVLQPYGAGKHYWISANCVNAG